MFREQSFQILGIRATDNFTQPRNISYPILTIEKFITTFEWPLLIESGVFVDFDDSILETEIEAKRMEVHLLKSSDITAENKQSKLQIEICIRKQTSYTSLKLALFERNFENIALVLLLCLLNIVL